MSSWLMQVYTQSRHLLGLEPRLGGVGIDHKVDEQTREHVVEGLIHAPDDFILGLLRELLRALEDDLTIPGQSAQIRSS